MKPAIVLVHGAFAESASWNSVIGSLARAGHRVIAAPNPLRARPPTRPRSATSFARSTGRSCSPATPTAGW
jgi:pimeloyl-ACP methyl ester carboxylesterase